MDQAKDRDHAVLDHSATEAPAKRVWAAPQVELITIDGMTLATSGPLTDTLSWASAS